MPTNEHYRSVEAPRTRTTLANDLRRLGLEPGTDVIVHASLSSLGWVCGGAVALIEALIDVIGPEGTLVMPAHSPELSDPGRWKHPPVPESWCAIIRDTMPAYDPARTPTWGLGRVAEMFRSWPGAVRSAHPTWSIAALGARALDIVRDHPLDLSMGERSPLAKLYDLNASALLLGAGFDSVTCFHLAEYRAPGAALITEGAPVLLEGNRTWREYQDLEFRTELFDSIGLAFEERAHVVTGPVGSAHARLFSAREAVDFAVNWLSSQDLGPTPEPAETP